MSMFDDVLGLGRTSSVTEGAVEFEPELENCTLESAEDLSEDIDLNDFMLEAAFNTERNMMAIDAAIMCEEYSYLREHGTEMVYEAGAISNIIEAAKNAVMRAWNTIQSYLKAAQKAISETSDENFKKKYQKKTENISSVKIKGSSKLWYAKGAFEHGLSTVYKGLEQCAEDIKASSPNKDVSKVLQKQFKVKSDEDIRAAIDTAVGVVKKSDMVDFDASVKSAWTILEYYPKMKSDLKQMYNNSKGIINKAISGLKDLEKEAKKKNVIPTEESKKIHEKVKLANKCSGYLVYANRAAVKFVNQGRAQAKAVILAAARKSATGESATVTDEGTSFLANINLV